MDGQPATIMPLTTTVGERRVSGFESKYQHEHLVSVLFSGGSGA